MRQNARRLICLLLTLLLCFTLFAGCHDKAQEKIEETDTTDQTVQDTAPVEARDEEKFDLLLDELFVKVASSDSISRNYYVADPSRFGIEEPSPTYGETTSPESIERDREENRELSDRLRELSYNELRDDQRIAYDILMRNLELIEMMDEKDEYSYYLGEIYPVSGIQVQLPILLAEFKFRRTEDIETYLLLLEDTRRYFGELIEFERERSRRGFFLNDVNVDKVISNCESFLENREDNLLILIFDDKIDEYEGLDPGQREQFKQRNRELVLDNVLVAYETLMEAMRELRGQGANQEGLANLPDGKEFAKAYLRYLTGSEKTPEEVDALLEEQLDQIFSTIGTIFASNPEFLDRYMSDELGSIPDQKPENYLKMLEKRIINDFPAIEPVQYVVREVHESLQEFTSPAFYLTPAVDSFSDNVIYINPSDITDNISLYTTLAHEGYPGHLYQRVYYLQQSPHPIRSVIGDLGYTEGWATYVEMQSYYYSVLEESEATVVQYMQMYNLLLLSRVDLGVNALGWGLDKVASFLSGLGITDKDSLDEIYQMVTCDPLLYMPYALGYMEFELLRAEAEEALGEDFVPMEFHRFLLDIGPAPFELIRSRMPAWIETQPAAALSPAA